MLIRSRQVNLSYLKDSRIKNESLKRDSLKKINKVFNKSGAGGNRTRVQTYSSKAFYMFISELLVGHSQERNKPMSGVAE